MSKYAPLGRYLLGAGKSDVPMTFAEIETVLGSELPGSAKRYPAWWSNTDGSHVQAQSWLAVGYKTERVDIGGAKLVFSKTAKVMGFGEMTQAQFGGAKKGHKNPTETADKRPYRHPAFGALAGMITLHPDVDYTQPADPDWGKSMTTRLLLDTCAILYITQKVDLSMTAVAALDEARDRDETVAISPISAWEIGLLVAKGRLSVAAKPIDYFKAFAALPGIRLGDLSSEILVDSSFLPGNLHGDPADRIIIATARALDLTVVTRDRSILEYAELGHVRALPC